MRIGYACIVQGVAYTQLNNCILKNASALRLNELIDNNLNVLGSIIRYNYENGIKMFRISSDLIPFASNSCNNIKWWEDYSERFSEIAQLIKDCDIRVSMHPGQYTVLNSPNEDVVCRSIDELIYHNRVLDALNISSDGKIVVHIGGLYGDKVSAIRRFESNYLRLSDSIKRRLVIENDDKFFNINDVLDISSRLDIPVIYDNLHNTINPYDNKISIDKWIGHCCSTWKKADGVPKVHYSQQNQAKRPGTHSMSIGIDEFLDFFNRIKTNNIDIMLEVKDKNISANKCINTIENRGNKALEIEWARYRYAVLEHSPQLYIDIRKLLTDKGSYPVVLFYNLIERAMSIEVTKGNAIYALQHIWSYFNKISTDREKSIFMNYMAKYNDDKVRLVLIKKMLYRLSCKYRVEYLMSSYYYVL